MRNLYFFMSFMLLSCGDYQKEIDRIHEETERLRKEMEKEKIEIDKAKKKALANIKKDKENFDKKMEERNNNIEKESERREALLKELSETRERTANIEISIRKLQETLNPTEKDDKEIEELKAEKILLNNKYLEILEELKRS